MNTHELLNAFESQLFVDKVTITVDKRNGRKCITNVIGMATDLDLHKIVSHLKKTYNCNGSILKDDVHGDVISLTGDQKEEVFRFLVDEGICKKEHIIVKGV